jgi:hypothetical protein
MPYTRVTLGDLRLRLAARYDAVPFWEEQDADDAINTALRVFNLLTGTWRRREPLMTVADQAIYGVSAPLLATTRIAYREVPLEPTAFSDLRLTRPAWYIERTTTGRDVPTTPTVWAPWGLTGVVIWPAPAVGGELLTVDGVADTPVLQAGGDYLDLDEGLLGDLLDLALAFTALRPGGGVSQDLRPRFLRAFTAIAHQNGQLASISAFMHGLHDGSDDLERTAASHAGDRDWGAHLGDESLDR